MKKFITGFLMCIALISMSFTQTAKANDSPPKTETVFTLEQPSLELAYACEFATCMTCHDYTKAPSETPFTNYSKTSDDFGLPVRSLHIKRPQLQSANSYTNHIYRSDYTSVTVMNPRGWNKRISC